MNFIFNYEEHLLKVPADTGVSSSSSSSSILETYTSAIFIKTDDIHTITWSTMGSKFTTIKTGICL
jgi:hypothetical protein